MISEFILLEPNIVVPVLGDSFQEFSSSPSPGGGEGGSLALSLDLGNNMDTNRKALDSYLVWSPVIWEVWVIGLGFIYGRIFCLGRGSR